MYLYRQGHPRVLFSHGAMSSWAVGFGRSSLKSSKSLAAPTLSLSPRSFHLHDVVASGAGLLEQAHTPWAAALCSTEAKIPRSDLGGSIQRHCWCVENRPGHVCLNLRPACTLCLEIEAHPTEPAVLRLLGPFTYLNLGCLQVQPPHTARVC